MDMVWSEQNIKGIQSMAGMNLKVNMDLSEMASVVQVVCMAMDCNWNTANRSHGQSIAQCDFKHICLTNEGKCGSYLRRVNHDG